MDGGQEVHVLDDVHHAAWTLTARGIYVLDRDTKPLPSIRFLDFETGNVSRIAEVTEEAGGGGSWISVSPDDDWLVYWDLKIEEDLMLVENFR